MMQEGQAEVEAGDLGVVGSGKVQQSAGFTGNASQPSTGREQHVWWTSFDSCPIGVSADSCPAGAPCLRE